MKQNMILFSALMFGCGDKEDSAELVEEVVPEEETAVETEEVEE